MIRCVADEINMRVLIITNVIPYPPISGGALRVYNLLRRIAKRHDVWLATHLHTPDEAEGIPHLREFCQEVVTGLLNRKHPIAHLPGLLRYALAGWPLELKFLHSKELEQKLRHILSKVDFNIVHIKESDLGLYLQTIPPYAQCKRILTFFDIDFSQIYRIATLKQRLIKKWRSWLFSRMMHRWEPRYAERFDRCITVSDIDRQLLMTANKRLRVDVIPNGVDTQLYQPLRYEDASPNLLFIGAMDFLPSIDAAVYFCRDILPRIKQKVSEIEIWIVGRDPVHEVMQLDGNGVHVTGRVADVLPYYRKSSVCVVPLRAGGGTRLKILEAMALGRPVVSTSIGCEGLDVDDGEHLLIADSSEQFAEKTVRLLTDKTLYEHITTNARKLVVSRYDWDGIAEQLMQIYTEVTETG